MKIIAKISITRPSWSDGKKAISITITDEASRVEFFDGEITLEDFAECVTGHGFKEIIAEVRGLDAVGKTRVKEDRSIEYTGPKTYKRDEYRAWLEENGKENGWIIDSYLGSQTSISHKGDKTFLNYSAHKFIEP